MEVVITAHALFIADMNESITALRRWEREQRMATDLLIKKIEEYPWNILRN